MNRAWREGTFLLSSDLRCICCHLWSTTTLPDCNLLSVRLSSECMSSSCTRKLSWGHSPHIVSAPFPRSVFNLNMKMKSRSVFIFVMNTKDLIFYPFPSSLLSFFNYISHCFLKIIFVLFFLSFMLEKRSKVEPKSLALPRRFFRIIWVPSPYIFLTLKWLVISLLVTGRFFWMETNRVIPQRNMKIVTSISSLWTTWVKTLVSKGKFLRSSFKKNC